jgi:hypothetical protein
LDGVRPAFSADRFFSWNHWEADGAVNRLAIESAPGPATTDSVRAAGVMIVFVLTGAALWLAQRPAACDLLWRWPQVVGVLLGLAYWAWLRPPWLGWLIVAASLLLLLWPGWPAHSQRAESTTVLRVRRPK